MADRNIHNVLTVQNSLLQQQNHVLERIAASLEKLAAPPILDDGGRPDKSPLGIISE